MSVAVLHQPGDDPDKQEIARLRAALNAVRVDLANAEVDLAVKRRQITEMKGLLHEKVVTSEYMTHAHEVFDYWCAHCRPGSTRIIFGDKRKKAVLARLRDGYTADDLMEAIDGAAVDAYTNEKGITYDDLELICRDETKVDMFVKRARAHRRDLSKMSQAQVIARLEAVAGKPGYDKTADEFAFKCVVCRTWWEDRLYRPLRVRFDNRKVSVHCLVDGCDADLTSVRDAL